MLSLGNVLTIIDSALIDYFPSKEVKVFVSTRKSVRHKAGHTGYYIYYRVDREYRLELDKDQFSPGDQITIEYLEAVPAIRRVNTN